MAEQRLALKKKIDDRLDEIERLAVDRKNAQNLAFLSEQERPVDRGGDVADLGLVVSAVNQGLPHADAATTEVQQKYATLKLKAQGRHDDAVRRQQWLQFEGEYHDLVRKGSLRAAAQRLAERSPESAALEVLKVDFRKKCLTRLADQKDTFLKDRQWTRAGEILSTVRRDRYARALLADEQQRKIEDMEHDVRVAHDRYLYAEVADPKTRSLAAIRKYLEEAPLKTMKGKVKDYRVYLREMDGTLKLRLTIASIEWGKKAWERKNTVTVSVGGKEVIDTTVTSEGNTTSSDVGGGTLACRLNDKVNLNITILAKTRGFLFISEVPEDNGKGSFDGKARDLLGAGKTIELSKYENRMVLKIDRDSLPKEPSLPRWRE